MEFIDPMEHVMFVEYEMAKTQNKMKCGRAAKGQSLEI